MSSTATITKIKFDDEGFFGSLLSRDFKPGYNNVGLEDLIIEDFCDDTTFLALFLSACANNGEFDESNILSVKASESGIVERVYTPTVFATEGGEELVLRSGANIFPVKQDGRTFICGTLKGELESYEVRDSNDNKYYVPRIDFMAPEGGLLFSVRVWIKKGGDPEFLKLHARGGNPIAGFLQEAKTGSAQTVKPTELPEGEYQVIAIDKKVHEDYGASYLIVLEGDKAIWSNYALKGQLNKSFEGFSTLLKNGKPVTLKIAGIREAKNGHLTCDAVLLTRKPYGNTFAPGFKPKEITGHQEAIADLGLTPTKNLKSAAPSATPDDGLLPF